LIAGCSGNRANPAFKLFIDRFSMKKNLKLKPTEAAVFHAASRIYAAYIVSGQVGDQEADTWMNRAIAEAIKMADTTDQLVVSDDELDSLGF
jgi:hypothetical protein